MISFLLLLFMTTTSTKKLFRKYHAYHKVIYLILILTTIHFVMAQKSLSLIQYAYLLGALIIVLAKIRQKSARWQHLSIKIS